LQNKSGALAVAGAPFLFVHRQTWQFCVTPRKKSLARRGGPGSSKYSHESVAIVVVVIPIAIGMPAAAVFIPPAMPFIPAAFPRLMQIVPCVIGLPAIPAVMLHGFVQSVVGLGDAALAVVVGIRQCTGCSGKCQHANKCCSSEYGLSEISLLSRVKRHVSSILPKYPRLGWGVLFHRTHLRRECSKRRVMP
jgi:hypothetical protein